MISVHAYDKFQQIGGQQSIVEIDESKFGKRKTKLFHFNLDRRMFSFSLFSGKYNRGRKRDGVWVFGGVDRETDECFMVPVPDRKADTLLPIIKKFIRPGTTIYSDFWKACDCLE